MIEIDILDECCTIDYGVKMKINPIRFRTSAENLDILVQRTKQGQKTEDVWGYFGDGTVMRLYGCWVDKDVPDFINVDFVKEIKVADMTSYQRLLRWTRRDSKILESLNLEIGDIVEDDDGCELALYSESTKYIISASMASSSETVPYLGCIATERYGIRGNDLADGDLGEFTWNRIIADIQYYETLIEIERNSQS